MRIFAGFDVMNYEFKVLVIDTGKGISSDQIPKLCQKFGRVFRTAKMNHEGVGLGLMISKALIEENGGYL